MGGAFSRIADIETVANLQQRLEGIGAQKDNSLLDRGYNRLLNNPGYLILGAGEGDYERLDPDPTQPLEELYKEFHSTLGNILMSYGVIGFVIISVCLF